MRISPEIKSPLASACAVRCSTHRVSLAVAVITVHLLSSLSIFSSPAYAHFNSNSEQNSVTPGLVARDGSFYLDERPFRIISGSFHYFRTRPEQWKYRLERMKAGYVNTVSTYIPWNLHERRRGEYNFTVDGWDIVRFIRLVQQTGLYMIVRAGPYINSQRDFGGLPSWLLHDPNMVTRTHTYQPYMNHVKRYFDQLLPLLAPLTYQKGGPIIAFQVENEFGLSFTSPDPSYLQFLVNLFRSHSLNELLFTTDYVDTTDHADTLQSGTLPGMLATVVLNEAADEQLKVLELFQPGKPLMVSEFWTGWYDLWGEEHSTMPVAQFRHVADEIFKRDASINLYMFVGGTDFWFWNGAQGNESPLPQTTSYDYDALVSECGDIRRDKFRAFQALLRKYGFITDSQLQQPLPQDPPKQAYGIVELEHVLTMDSVSQLVVDTVTLQDPVYMEFLPVNGDGGQGYGYIIYRAYFRGTVVTMKGELHDWAQVYVNGLLIKTIISHDVPVDISFAISSEVSDRNCIEILVENMGHVDYWYSRPKHSNDRKGFQGEISSDIEKINNWEHVPLEFDSHLIDAIQNSKDWKPAASASGTARLYRGSLFISEEPLDTFLDMSDWGKGFAVVNGFVLGRYWNIGPQMTLYVPWPLLQTGKNEVMVFELEQAGSTLNFIDYPILASTTVYK